jgi:hypothetical protein
VALNSQVLSKWKLSVGQLGKYLCNTFCKWEYIHLFLANGCTIRGETMWSGIFHIELPLSYIWLKECSPNIDGLFKPQHFMRINIKRYIIVIYLHHTWPYSAKSKINGLYLIFHSRLLIHGLVVRYHLVYTSDLVMTSIRFHHLCGILVYFETTFLLFLLCNIPHHISSSSVGYTFGRHLDIASYGCVFYWTI